MNSNQWLDQLKKKRKVRMVFSILMIIASSLLQTYVIQAFINPANLLSAGFTGVAILLDRIAQLCGGFFPPCPAGRSHGQGLTQPLLWPCSQA